MTLSERLAAAERVRTGTPDGVREPERADPPSGAAMVVIDLRTRRWAEPGRCPRCGDVGEVDVVDLVAGVLHQRCDPCRTDWRIRR